MLFSLLLACSVRDSDAPQPVSPLNLQLYSTPTVFVASSATPAAVETSVILPTPTPFSYTVKAGDTLSQVAQRYGLTLDEVLASNPGISVQTLSIGQSLQIPSRSAALVNFAPAPAALQIGPVECFPSGAGMWCLALAHNPYSEPVENSSAQIHLFSDPPLAQEALLPLNILPPRASLPFFAFFASRPAQSAPARLDLATAFLLSASDQRYLPAKVDNLLVQIVSDGLSAQVSGRFFMVNKNQPASEIWLAGVAYAEDGHMVGVRRWQSQTPLEAGQSQTFSFYIYSLRKSIASVDVVIEARP